MKEVPGKKMILGLSYDIILRKEGFGGVIFNKKI